MVGQRIKEIRIEKNLSLRKLGELSDLSYAQICRLENEFDTRTGKAPCITIDALARVCTGLGYDLVTFLEETHFLPPRPADEVELVETYRSLTEDKKAIALDQIKSLL